MSGEMLVCGRCNAEVPFEYRTCPTCGAMIIATVFVPGSRDTFKPFPENVAQVGTGKRASQDLRMLKSPEFWPHKILPLKRYHDGNLETGVWDGWKFYPNVNLYPSLANGVDPASGYVITPEELVTRGWTVD